MVKQKKHKNKILLDEAWAASFLAKRFKKYWPTAKSLVAVKVSLLKVFLNYLRFTVRYQVFVKNSHGKIEEKRIIVKAERIKNFNWPPRIGKVHRDFLATRFLKQQGLGKILPRPLEFYKPLMAYFYEEAPGQPLKSLIQRGNWQVNKFFKYIPVVMRSLKKIHAVKKRPAYDSGDQKEAIEDGINEWLKTITKYYPAGEKRATDIVKILKKLEKKYANKLFNKKSYRTTHGDFQNDNILIGEKKRVIFIDFSDSKKFNPLDDLASFLIQSELHLRYVKPKLYRSLSKKLAKIAYTAYFGREIRLSEEMQIEFFAAKDILRIITFLSFTQKPWQTIPDHNNMMDSLLSFTEEKIKNLEKKYL